MQRDLSKIIIIILVVAIAIVSIAGTFLYLKTDLFKSRDMLFKKYLSQNISSFVEILNFEEEEELIKTLNENDYAETIDAKIKYQENENDEEEVYKISGKGVVNNSDKTSYRKISTSYKEESLLQAELLKQNNIYGIRLAELFPQFLSIENSNLAYLISSMGYDGEYFSDKINPIDLSGIFSFSEEEIEALKENYMEDIFKDIDSKSYSITRNSIITLSNDSSVTTTAYSLTLTRNELDKIYKRIINKAINDEIIIGKVEQIEAQIKEAGLVDSDGESLKDRFTKSLQEISDNLEYTGENKSKIVIKVYQTQGETVRTEIKTDTNKITIDIINLDYGKEITLKTEEFTDEGSNINNYSVSKVIENGTVERSISYTIGEVENLEFEIDLVNKSDEKAIKTNVVFSNEAMENLNLEANISYDIGETKKIPDVFVEDSKIPYVVFNNYDGEQIINILTGIKSKIVQSLEEKQKNINTKMLNNILLWVDARDKEMAEEQVNNEERKKQRFNNKFKLYAGENLDFEHVQRLLNVVGSNMSDYKVVNGNQIKIFIENGTENKEKIDEISKVITDKHTYNVGIEYSDEGYVNAITITIYVEN